MFPKVTFSSEQCFKRQFAALTLLMPAAFRKKIYREEIFAFFAFEPKLVKYVRQSFYFSLFANDNSKHFAFLPTHKSLFL